jgi:small GTP-binding protein
MKKKKQIKINFWDTAGQERFRAITKTQLYGSNIVIFCCEDEKSFESIKEIWYKECEQLIDLSKCLKFVLKTKCDIKNDNQHLLKDIKKYANEIDAIFFETSAKDNINIDALYESICFNVEKLKLEDDEAQIRINRIDNQSKYNSSNCWC